MSPLFRRRRDAGPDSTGDGIADGSPADGEVAVDDPADGDGADPGGAAGPYDADDDIPAGRRLDLGALRVPVVEGTQLQLEVDRTAKVARSTTVVAGPSRVRLSAFAAPRSAGVWDEVRAEIVAEVTKVGGAVKQVDGSFGTEVVTSIPTRLQDGRQALQVQRFVGVDGPRWFLRAVFSGPEVVRAAGIQVPDGSADEARLAMLEDVVRGCVVVRGSQARPPREPLTLTLPTGAAQTDAPVQGTETDG